jgi:hypothetical protein
MILTTIEARRVQSLTLTENDTVVAVRQKIPVLFGNILQLLPNTKTIAVVTGNSERFWIEEIKRELEPLKDRVTLRFYNDLSFDQILKEAASLPPDSAIYWNQTRVARGEVHEGQRALTELAAVLFHWRDRRRANGFSIGWYQCYDRCRSTCSRWRKAVRHKDAAS